MAELDFSQERELRPNRVVELTYEHLVRELARARGAPRTFLNFDYGYGTIGGVGGQKRTILSNHLEKVNVFDIGKERGILLTLGYLDDQNSSTPDSDLPFSLSLNVVLAERRPEGVLGDERALRGLLRHMFFGTEERPMRIVVQQRLGTVFSSDKKIDNLIKDKAVQERINREREIPDVLGAVYFDLSLEPIIGDPQENVNEGDSFELDTPQVLAQKIAERFSEAGIARYIKAREVIHRVKSKQREQNQKTRDLQDRENPLNLHDLIQVKLFVEELDRDELEALRSYPGMIFNGNTLASIPQELDPDKEWWHLEGEWRTVHNFPISLPRTKDGSELEALYLRFNRFRVDYELFVPYLAVLAMRENN